MRGQHFAAMLGAVRRYRCAAPFFLYMANTADLKKKAKELRQLAAKAEKAAGVKSDIERKREARAEGKDVIIPPCADRERRELLESDDREWLLWYFAPESGTRDPFTYQFTSQQVIMLDAIRDAIVNGEDQAIAATRGEGKTTYFERLLLKYTLQGKINFAVLFAATGGSAEDSLESIKYEIESNDRLCEDYPEVCVPVRALENTPNRAHYQTVSGKRHDNGQVFAIVPSKFSWCGQEIYLPNVPGSPSAAAIIATRGLDAAVRGLKKRGRRPQIVGIDDPDTEDTARSEDQAAKIEKRIDRAIAGLGSQKQRVARVMLTTLQSRISVSYRYTDPKQKPSWRGKRFKFLVSPPNNEKMWDEYMTILQDDWRNGTALALKFYAEHFDQMNAGAVVANPNRKDAQHLSALQFYYDQVARIGKEAVATEYDNDPPEEALLEGSLILTPNRVQTAWSGFGQGIVPKDTAALTCGADVGLRGLHYAVLSHTEDGRSRVIQYAFHEFRTEGLKASDAESRILAGLLDWWEHLEANPFMSDDGQLWPLNCTLVDSGWRDESWQSQPVQIFAHDSGPTVRPCKGVPNYRTPKQSISNTIGDNWYFSTTAEGPLVQINSDHWKLKVHDGFLLESDEPGSLTVYTPPEENGRINRLKHVSYSNHICSERWETRPQTGFAPARTGWKKIPGKQNHWFDATYYALVARAVVGIHPIRTVVNAEKMKIVQEQAAHTQKAAATSERHERTVTRRRINFRR